MGLSVSELYDMYVDESKTFAQDIWAIFGEEGTKLPASWQDDYGKYIPKYDPTGEDFAKRSRKLSDKHAVAARILSNKKTDIAYDSDLEDISSTLGKEVKQAHNVMGKLNLRSGDLESAIDSAIATSANKADTLANAYELDKEDILNQYNKSIVSSALDLDKDMYDDKKAWYEDVLRLIDKLDQKGAFKACEDGLVQCWDGTCDTEARCEEKRKEWGTDIRDHFGEILPGFEMDIMNWPESATND